MRQDQQDLLSFISPSFRVYKLLLSLSLLYSCQGAIVSESRNEKVQCPLPSRVAFGERALWSFILSLTLSLSLARADEPPPQAEPASPPASAVLAAPNASAVSAVPAVPPMMAAPPAAPPLAETELRPARSDLLPVPLASLAGLEDAVAAQLTDAQDSLRSLLSSPDIPDTELSQALGTMGQLYHAYGLFVSAQACYTNAIQLAPQVFPWTYLLADVLQRQGQSENAVAMYRRVLEIAPDNTAALVNLGKAYREANQAQAAQEVLTRALELEPQSAAVHAELGQAAFVQEHYAEAVEHFEAALQLVPAANRLHYPLAMAYRQLKDEDKAKAHLEQRGAVGVKVADPFIAEVERLVQGARLQLVRGKLAFQAHRYREAMAAFNAAIQADPDNAAAWANLGTTLVQLGRTNSAIAQFREALRLQPENMTAHYNLGTLLLSAGQVREAVSHLRTSIISNPKDQPAHLSLGTALRQLGREEEALVHYAIAADLNPGDETAVQWTAELLAGQGRYQAARDRLDAAYRRFPSQGQTAHVLARLLATSPDPAVRNGQRALDLANLVYKAKKAPQFAETIAFALAELGRCEEASQWQRELVATAEKEGDAVLLRRLQTTLSRYEKGVPCRPPLGETAVAHTQADTRPAVVPPPSAAETPPT